jgi:hypothetical protein
VLDFNLFDTLRLRDVLERSFYVLNLLVSFILLVYHSFGRNCLYQRLVLFVVFFERLYDFENIHAVLIFFVLFVLLLLFTKVFLVFKIKLPDGANLVWRDNHPSEHLFMEHKVLDPKHMENFFLSQQINLEISTL